MECLVLVFRSKIATIWPQNVSLHRVLQGGVHSEWFAGMAKSVKARLARPRQGSRSSGLTQQSFGPSAS